MDYGAVENLSLNEINDLYFDIIENGGEYTSTVYFRLRHRVTCANGSRWESGWNGSVYNGNCTDYNKARIGYCNYVASCSGTGECSGGAVNGNWAVAYRCGYNTYGYVCVSACKME